MGWSGIPSDEIERRRTASVAAMAERNRSEFEKQYQKYCDSMYWRIGKCCAGCDHWQSDGGLTGRCAAAGIMSGADVLRSMNLSSSSYMPKPGFPFTDAKHLCGLFRDDFDWLTLDDAYLRETGAMKNGTLREKP